MFPILVWHYFLDILGGIFDEKGTEKCEQGCVGLIPPRKIKHRIYRCDKKFHTEVAVELFHEAECYGIVYVGGTESKFYRVHGTDPKLLDTIHGFIKNQHKKGGQSQNRYQRLTQIQIDEYVKAVMEKCQNLYTDSDLALVLCGSGSKKDWVRDRLEPNLQDRTTLWTLPDDDIGPVLSEFTIPNTEEKKQIDRFYDELRNDMVVYGKAETLQYLQCGYLDVVMCLDETWADMASNYGTTCIVVTDHRFIREFGGYGGITRWKIN